MIAVVTALVAATMSFGASPASATRDNFIPPNGPVFNDPHGTPAEVRTLIRHLNRTIDSVPRKGKIRIASWNVRSHNVASALIRAHRRGVSVQVVMDRNNWNPNNPNVDAQRLAREIKKKNKKRPVAMRSWVKRCKGSCRGSSGIAHSKFFMFDKVRGKKNASTKKFKVARNVVMYGSYNATELGATIQWNDLYTIKGSVKHYALFDRVFKQMRKDKKVKQGFVGFDNGKTATQFYPYTGKKTKQDPVLKSLKGVQCKGARTKGGVTRIRIAQTAMHGERGLVLAKRLAQLQKQGCGIRLVYAMFGNKVLGILRAAGVPLTHLAWDSNADGIYDRYVHAKSMTIVGQVNGKKTRTTYNGSANWTGTALVSDEVVGIIRRPKITHKYMAWIDKLFKSRPSAWDYTARRGFAARGDGAQGLDSPDHLVVEKQLRARGVDPYALIKQEL